MSESRKKILLVSPPFRGHLHPILGIARRLKDVADVTVVSTAEGVKVAAGAGVPAHEVMAGEEERIRAIIEPGHNVKNNPIRLYRQFRANVGLMARLKREMSNLYIETGPDLVIADFTLPVAGLAALEQGISWWTALPSPCVVETPDGPPAYFGGQTPAQNTVNRLKQRAMRQSIRLFKRGMWWLFQGSLQELGFEGVYRSNGSEVLYSPQRILALGTKELEFPATYPPQLRFVGPVLYTPDFEGPSPVFNEEGRQRVLISLGTHLPHEKSNVAAVIKVIAERHPGIEFHFTRGEVNSHSSVQKGNLHEYPYISYAIHLPKYDLVVHHGGAGVMHYCLKHAVPAVVLPQDYDQFDYAARLVSAGVAIQARGIKDLEDAIVQALESPTLQSRCEEMSRIYAQYDAEGTISTMVTDT